MSATEGANLVLIHCHDLGRYLGRYDRRIETPHIDALADRGITFDRHFVSAPQCSPSRGSLMTGCYPHNHGLMGLAHGSWELDAGCALLPSLLSEHGYDTHLFGLQHVSQDTGRLGYDHVHSEGNLYPGVTPAVHQSNRAASVAAVFDDWLSAGPRDEPFFASIGFFELHRVEDDRGRFGFDRDRYEIDSPDAVDPLPYLPDRPGIRRDLGDMHGMVYAIDDAVATIVASLEAAGVDSDTLIVFTTEHGIAFPRAKGSCYDPGIEAALLMAHPDITPAGVRSNALISNVDVLPTLLEILDVPGPEGIDGQSFAPIVHGEPDKYTPRDHIFAELTWHDTYNPVRAIRTDRYKYIRNFWHLDHVYLTRDIFASEAGREVREQMGVPYRRYEELYDLQEDPQEQDNVIDEPTYQDIRSALRRRLHDWMDETNDPLLDGPIPPGDFDEIMAEPPGKPPDT